MPNDTDTARARQGKDVWNAWAEENPGTEVVFSGTLSVKNFSGFIFPGNAHFSGSTSQEAVSFEGARFLGDALFAGTNYKGVNFTDTTFEGRTVFNNSKFRHSNVFVRATFRRRADFVGAKLLDRNSSLSFVRAKFHDDANFEYFEVESGVSFKEAKFHSLATFDDAEMSKRAVFTGCTFDSVPTFFGARLHVDTTFEGVIWPERKHKKQSSYDAVRAWVRLRVEMNRLHKHEDELSFFVKELSFRLEDKSNEPLAKRWLYRTYLALGAGQDISKPLAWLLGLNVFLFFPVHWFAIAAIQGREVLVRDMLADLLAQKVPTDVISFTLGQALPFIGGSNPERTDLYRRLFQQSKDVGIDVPMWLELLGAFQQLVGIVLVFMIGLALRNRFRMR